MITRLKFFSCALAAVSLLGCSPLPQAEFTSYLEISDEATTSGEVIYGALNKVILREQNPAGAAARQDCAPSDKTPSCFDPSFFLPDTAITDPSVEARLLALETIAAYNDTLAALNSGESGAALTRRVEGLSGVAQNLLRVAPVGGSVTAILGEPVLAAVGGLVGKLEGARARAAVRRSILEEAGTIKGIIRALIADTPAVYNLYAIGQNKYALSLPGGFTSPEANAEHAKVGAMHESLGAYVVLLANTQKSIDVLTTALATQNADPATLQAAIDQTLELKLAARTLRQKVVALGN